MMTNGSINGEDHTILYRGKCLAEKRVLVFKFIERSLGIYLRPLRVHSQVLMESTNALYRSTGYSFTRFYFASLLPDSSWMRDRDFQFSRQAHSYPVNSITSSHVAQCRDYFKRAITINYEILYWKGILTCGKRGIFFVYLKLTFKQ